MLEYSFLSLFVLKQKVSKSFVVVQPIKKPMFFVLEAHIVKGFACNSMPLLGKLDPNNAKNFIRNHIGTDGAEVKHSS